MTLGMVEEYKAINGYEGYYSVSSMGNIYSHKSGRLLKQTTTKHGYRHVVLSKENKASGFLVHRLVAFSFVEGYEKDLEINHINFDKTNNMSYNLEWCTRKYNNIYSKAKCYLITHPCGKEEIIFNLSEFARNNAISQSGLNMVASGTRIQCRGFTAKLLCLT
jgi:hypothetical protein